MSWYKTGTVSVNTGQTSVIGVGTKFASNARVGDGFRAPDGEWYEIVNIASETVLGIFPAYIGPSVSTSTSWMVAPLQGYNKESADRLRAITDNISATIDSINNKQDKSAKLTSISNLSGTVNRYTLPFLSGVSNDFVPALLAENARDTNTSNIPQIGHAGWGSTNPINLNATSDINNILQNAMFVCSGLTPAGIPSGTGDFYLQNINNGGGWITQTAWEVTGPRSYTRWKNSNTGVWSEWSEIYTTTAKIDASSQTKLRLRNYLGIGTPHTYCVNIDALTQDQSLVLGYSYVSSTTTGTKPGGYVFGVVNTVISTGDHCQQEFVGLTAQAGVTQRSYRRSGYGAQWGPWRLVIDSDSATAMTVEEGGIISQTRIGGVTRTKFASGLQIVNGNFGNTPSVGVGQSGIINLTIPINTGIDTAYTSTNVTATPFNTYDWYGVITSYMSSATNLVLVCRNGATEQQFSVRGTIIGYWK